MKLFHYRGAVPNFGDDLNTLLWRALAPDLIDDDPEHAFVGIGTIIGRHDAPGKTLHVFSSGIGNDPLDGWRGREIKYWCVRGPISCTLLDLPPETAITDGAILTPFAQGFPKAASPGGSTLVIPHFQTLGFPGWDRVAALCGLALLDPRDDPRTVIAKIASARLVLTESLHGAILADTYGIPWRIFATSASFGSTKFVDWCESLGLPLSLTYVPPPNPVQILDLGIGPCVWGKTVNYTREDALAAFGGRIAPPRPPGIRGRLKSRLRRHKALHPLLGYSPTRTAAALTRLAEGPPQQSSPTVRQRLQDRMMTRLAEVRAFNRGIR